MTAYIVSVSQPLVFEVEATDDLSARAAAMKYELVVLMEAGKKKPAQGWPVIESVTAAVQPSK